MKKFMRMFLVAASSMLLAGCYLPQGQLDPKTGLVLESFPEFLDTGDHINRTGVFACDLGGIKFDLSLTEKVSGDGFDLNYTYALTVKLKDKLFADAEAKRMTKKLPQTAQSTVTAQMAMADKALRTTFRKRVSAPTLAQIVNEKGKVQYAYFDFSKTDVFSILTADYENKRDAIDRLTTDDIKSEALIGFVGVTGPHDDVRRMIAQTSWEHLTVLATCS